MSDDERRTEPVGLGIERPDDVASIAADPQRNAEGHGFPEGPRQARGGPRPPGEGGMWHPGAGGGPSGGEDDIDWEDRYRSGVSKEA